MFLRAIDIFMHTFSYVNLDGCEWLPILTVYCALSLSQTPQDLRMRNANGELRLFWVMTEDASSRNSLDSRESGFARFLTRDSHQLRSFLVSLRQKCSTKWKKIRQSRIRYKTISDKDRRNMTILGLLYFQTTRTSWIFFYAAARIGCEGWRGGNRLTIAGNYVESPFIFCRIV